jgi:hypothetical protein
MKSTRHTGKFPAWNMGQLTETQTIGDFINVVEPKKNSEVCTSGQLLI